MVKLNYLDDGIDFEQINRILVIKLQLLGDVLLTTPLYSVIKQQFPQIKIDVLIYKETTVVLDDNPAINNLHLIDRNWKKQGIFAQIRHETRLFTQLKNDPYDLIINLTDRWRGGALSYLLKPKYSVSLAYSHRRGKLWQTIFTHIYSTPQHNRHIVETHLDAVRRLGLNLQSADKKLTLQVSDVSKLKIQHLLINHQQEHQKIIVIHPTSRWMFKAWNPSAFAAVIDLLSQAKFKVILISGSQADEIAYVKNIAETSTQKDAINLAGQLSINECAGLIKQASCFIGLDSVAVHIAAAVNTPCVAIFGPTRESSWYPWMVEHKIITADYQCRPCGLKGCGDSMLSECIQAIQPHTVFQAVQSLLNRQSQES